MKIENNLSKYNGYVPNSVKSWKSQLNIDDDSKNKILKYLEIYSSRQIRKILRIIVSKNISIIGNAKSYICKFGPAGKSGDVLIYEFRHTFREYRSKIIETWEIPQLPENSTIIFIDDIVGTGTQSINQLQKLSQFLNSSHKAYLLCVCATPQGIKKIKENTTVSVIPGIVLMEDTHQHLNEKCKLFDNTEKTYLKELNSKLHDPNKGYYANLGLLLAFYYAVPNNTLPFIWKDGSSYADESGATKKWRALLPRYY